MLPLCGQQTPCLWAHRARQMRHSRSAPDRCAD
jgi:hypothetical protein